MVVDDDGQRAFVAHVVGAKMSVVDLASDKHEVRELDLRVNKVVGGQPAARGAQLASYAVFSGFNCGELVPPCIGALDSDILAALERIYAQRSTINFAAVNMISTRPSGATRPVPTVARAGKSRVNTSR